MAKVVPLGDHETLVWDSEGPGVPTLLIHALGLDRRFWRLVWPQLAARSRVIAYDLRGHGHAQEAPLTQTLVQLADDAVRLLDRLEVARADVYGASYGGAVAQHMTLAAGHRVRALGLIATATWFPRQEMEARAEAAEREGVGAQIPSSLMRWFLPETIAFNPWAVRYARKRIRTAKVANWAAAWRALARFDVHGKVANVMQTVLVLSGQQDKSSTPAMMDETAREYRRSELRRIDPGTHMAVLEQPEAVAAELTAFRARVDRG